MYLLAVELSTWTKEISFIHGILNMRRKKKLSQLLLVVFCHSQPHWEVPVDLYAISTLLFGFSSKFTNILLVIGIYD